MDIISDLLLFPLALLVWPVSKRLSCAFQLALVAAVMLRCGYEEARWASAATGLIGAVEMGLVLEFPTCRDDLKRFWIGALLLGPMTVDGLAWLLNRSNESWTQPAFQILIEVWTAWICIRSER